MKQNNYNTIILTKQNTSPKVHLMSKVHPIDHTPAEYTFTCRTIL